MDNLNPQDVLTQVTRYNLIRKGRLVYIDVHRALSGNLAGPYVAVPNLVNLVARHEFQGTGNSEKEALADCLAKVKDRRIEELFPETAAAGAPAGAADRQPADP